MKPLHDHPTWDPLYKPFHNIIYTPLDLPPPPEIDREKFNWWASNAAAQHLKTADQRVLLPDGRYRRSLLSMWKSAVGEYAWKSSHAMKETTSETDSPWVMDFDTLFPEIVDYLSLFPFFKLQSVNFLQQDPNIPVLLHTDPDNWIGFRFYLRNTVSKDALYFRQVKKEHFNGKRLPTYTLDKNLEPINSTLDTICQQEKLYADQKNLGRYPWALTSALAAHGVDTFDESEERITCVVVGKPMYQTQGVIAGYKAKETYDLLERSTKKFKHQQIRYVN